MVHRKKHNATRLISPPFNFPVYKSHQWITSSPTALVQSPVDLSAHSRNCSTEMGEGDGASKVFTMEEVSVHNTDKDCWLIINGKVCTLISDDNSLPYFYSFFCFATFFLQFQGFLDRNVFHLFFVCSLFISYYLFLDSVFCGYVMYS